MNLAEALNAALPELPVRRARIGYPKLDPALIFKENIDDGELGVSAMKRGEQGLFRFTLEQWRIVELFDGKRSWEDVADAHAELYGPRYDPDDLREFTAGLDAIDYRMTDVFLDPPEADVDGRYTERSLRLPETFWCYDPLVSEPDVNRLPAWRGDRSHLAV